MAGLGADSASSEMRQWNCTEALRSWVEWVFTQDLINERLLFVAVSWAFVLSMCRRHKMLF